MNLKFSRGAQKSRAAKIHHARKLRATAKVCATKLVDATLLRDQQMFGYQLLAFSRCLVSEPETINWMSDFSAAQ